MQISLSDTMLVTVTGIAIVFTVLIVLVAVMSLFGKVVSSSSKKPEKVAKETPDKPVVKAPSLPVAQNEDEDEIIAVIAAAVVAFSQSAGKQYAVRSIRRSSGRSAWASAGVYENTRPF